jgi:hypothetical protein
MPVLNADATKYLKALASPQKEICLALRKLILDNFPKMKEEYKWRYPAYYYEGKRICIIGGFKAHANIELFYGARLDDPKARVEGKGKRTRHIKLKTLDDIDNAYFIDLIRQSIELSQAPR